MKLYQKDKKQERKREKERNRKKQKREVIHHLGCSLSTRQANPFTDVIPKIQT
jgi:hypothetical protein